MPCGRQVYPSPMSRLMDQPTLNVVKGCEFAIYRGTKGQNSHHMGQHFQNQTQQLKYNQSDQLRPKQPLILRTNKGTFESIL